jgi:hypothetical protein
MVYILQYENLQPDYFGISQNFNLILQNFATIFHKLLQNKVFKKKRNYWKASSTRNKIKYLALFEQILILTN